MEIQGCSIGCCIHLSNGLDSEIIWEMLHLTDTEISLILSESAIEHVLEGEGAPDYRGGHRFGSGVVGKTVFPEHWSDADIIDSIRATLRNPSKVRHTRQHLVLTGLVDEVIVEVKLKIARNSKTFMHAFPQSGSGVFRVTHLGRVAVPLDLTSLEG